MGTAVNVQAMVFGNRSDDSATGVAFTRDPSTGERRHYGEFLVNAQGEDVVAGIRTPQPLTEEMKRATSSDLPSMEEVMPEAFAELAAVFDKSRSPLPGHAGHRVHHTGQAALDSADPVRQAHDTGST